MKKEEGGMKNEVEVAQRTPSLAVPETEHESFHSHANILRWHERLEREDVLPVLRETPGPHSFLQDGKTQEITKKSKKFPS
jgi:hypothetical protein